MADVDYIEEHQGNPVNFVYKSLIKRYADGRPICNCGEAYYNDRESCPHGCSANKIRAKYDLCVRMMKELEGGWVVADVGFKGRLVVLLRERFPGCSTCLVPNGNLLRGHVLWDGWKDVPDDQRRFQFNVLMLDHFSEDEIKWIDFIALMNREEAEAIGARDALTDARLENEWRQELEKTVCEQWPGFEVKCLKCGGKLVILDNSMGYSSISGAWGSVDFECRTPHCGNSVEIVST